MKFRRGLQGAAALLAMTSPLAPAQTTAAASAAGYNQIAVPARSDVLLTVPFNRSAEGMFTVAAKDAVSITVADSFEAGEYDKAYYVRFVSGSGEGLWSTISRTDANTLTVENTDVLEYVNEDDLFRIYPHHTIDSLFPPDMLGFSYQNGTTVLLFENDLDNMQQNKSAVGTSTYVTDPGQWGGDFEGDAILEPETKFVLRNDGDKELVFTAVGTVPDYTVRRIVAAGGDVDIGTGYPVPVALKDAGLTSEDRTVIVTDNGAAGINKSGNSATYFGDLGRWFGAKVDGDSLLEPSTAFTLRLPAGDSGRVTIPKPYE